MPKIKWTKDGKTRRGVDGRVERGACGEVEVSWSRDMRDTIRGAVESSIDPTLRHETAPLNFESTNRSSGPTASKPRI